MRVLFDTNVLISAFITRGASYEVFEHCVNSYDVYISGYIRNEVEHVLVEKFSFPDRNAKEVLRFLSDHLESIEPGALDRPVCRDSSDDPVLASALAAKADCLITGDEDLLILKKFKSIKIIKPGDFWKFEKSRMGKKPD